MRPTAQHKEESPMKTTKLVIGILSIVLSVFVLFQGCTANVADTLMESDTPVGVLGIFLAIILLVAGIVAIATRNNKAGGIVAGVFYLLGSLIGWAGSGTYYEDLPVWGFICAIFGYIFIFGSIFFMKNTPAQNVRVIHHYEDGSAIVEEGFDKGKYVDSIQDSPSITGIISKILVVLFFIQVIGITLFLFSIKLSGQ